VYALSSSNFSFCPPLPGKPNSRATFDPYSKEPPRVKQSPQKGETCSYYALQLLRNKRPAKDQQSAVEKEISHYRKVITEIDQPFLKDFAKELSIIISGPCTQKNAEKILKSRLKGIFQDQEKCSNALNTFCNQDKYDDFSHFAENEYLQTLINAHKFFLQKNGISTESAEAVEPFDAEWILQNVVFEFSRITYGAKKSSWHPDQPLENLIEQLNRHGPHYVAGKFGQMYYEDPPSELPTKVEGRSILRWKPNTKRVEGVSLHAVIIVGADSKKKHVYYIDPIDGSHPNDITSQKIYVMSYERVRASIADLTGAQRKDETGKYFFLPIQDEENNYALHM